MRDGTVLRADVYLPGKTEEASGDGAFPALMTRTPYDKRVGTFGASYDGWTQWELAHMRPPHLKAMMPSAIAANLLDRDVLCYSTPPLDEPLEVTGPITVKLWVASSARDTDFVAKLQDVWGEDGFTQELCHGIVRARYRASFDKPELMTPGQVYELTIRLNPTSNLFRRGHRIRLDITSSDFPNFDRNHNTGGNDYAESTLLPAHQTVFHDAARPSHVILPVVAA